MGKLILCNGKMASRPYHFTLTNTNIYSIEEFCFYLYHNIYAIYEDIFTEELILWIREELNMPELSTKLKELIDHKNTLKDIVVTILCASDYNSEEEIKSLIHIMDEISDLEPIRRQKIKADYYLKYKCYQLAEAEYSNILSSTDISILTGQEHGDVIHNQAIVKLHTASIREAANTFKEAYHYNQDEETLKEYIYCLKLGGLEKEYENDQIQDNFNSEILFEVNLEMNSVLDEVDVSHSFMKLKNLVSLKEEGKLNEFYRRADELTNEWKKEYRAD